MIQSLVEPCDRATYGERLRSGAKKLNISVRSLQRLFKKYQEQGLTALVSTGRADKGNHRITRISHKGDRQTGIKLGQCREEESFSY